RYRIELDFTKDKMAWTRLDFEPPPLQAFGGKGSGQAGLDAMGSIMKMFGALLGKKPEPEVSLRRFLGLEVSDSDEGGEVKAVLAKGPAALAGLEVGDHIVKVQGKAVSSRDEFQQTVEKFTAGQNVRLSLTREKKTREITVTIGKGL